MSICGCKQLLSLTIDIERQISRCGRKIRTETLIRRDTLRACQAAALRKRWNCLAGRQCMPSLVHCLPFRLALSEWSVA